MPTPRSEVERTAQRLSGLSLLDWISTTDHAREFWLTRARQEVVDARQSQ